MPPQAGITAARPFGCDVAVCVPFPYLSETAVALAASEVRWGAQDCSAHEQGAYTGEVSAAMLAEYKPTRAAAMARLSMSVAKTCTV